MDPITLSFLIAGGFQLFGGMAQASAMRDQARLQQQIAEFNAESIEQDAQEAEIFGLTETARYQTVIDATIGGQRVAFASQNVDVTTGTAAEVQKETRLIGFLNALDIQKAARNKAKGLRIDASNVRLGGFMSRLQGETNASAVQTSAFYLGIGTGISGYAGQAGRKKDAAHNKLFGHD